MLCEASTAWGGQMPKTLQLWKERHDAVDRSRAEEQKRETARSIARLERQQEEIADELEALRRG